MKNTFITLHDVKKFFELLAALTFIIFFGAFLYISIFEIDNHNMKLYEFFQLCCVLMVGSGCIWAILSAKPVKIGYIKNPCNLSPKNQDIEFKNFRNDLNHVFKYVSNIEQDFCLNQYISAKNANIVTNYKGELLKIYSDLSIDNYYKYIKEVNRIYKSVESLNNIIQSTLK